MRGVRSAVRGREDRRRGLCRPPGRDVLSDPMPLEPAQSLTLGLALGAAMGFARTLPAMRQVEHSDNLVSTSAVGNG